ncbi:hypothetical protein CQ10_17575 [Bradyrhizobium valentinum]|nr:hypothetical protein CQ10_17575 [Bradyrhizobium valentinum]
MQSLVGGAKLFVSGMGGVLGMAGLPAEPGADRPFMTVWIYVENAKQVGDRDHLKVFRARTRPRMVRGKRS